mmetsp:Transcript_4486/g.6708  ORF Transcript_4486/g.6708 Transcript_4486/m.6708 type:complete len:308 (+) Transcript_4486:2808-3731(+)
MVVIDDVSLDERLQALLDGLLVLDRQRNGEELLQPVVLVRAALADHFVAELAAKVTLDGLLERSAPDRCFESVKEHGVELVDIHLLVNVGWLAVPVLERVAETLGVDVLLLGLEQPHEQLLELVEHVLFWLQVFVVRVIDRQYCPPKSGHHVKLLEERDDVADAPQVLDPAVARSRLFIFRVSDLPVAFLVRSPGHFFVELLQVTKHRVEVVNAVSRQSRKQKQSVVARRFVFTDWLALEPLACAVRNLEQAGVQQVRHQLLAQSFLQLRVPLEENLESGKHSLEVEILVFVVGLVAFPAQDLCLQL